MKKLIILNILIILLYSMKIFAQSDIQSKPLFDLKDQASLQRGAKIFVNYCLSCHSASLMRYKRLTDLGVTDRQINENFIFTNAKIGDTMKVSLKKEDAVKWFGQAPPDLSLIARAKGAEYLYNYLNDFYYDPLRPSGWNNLTFDKVSMPHVLWQLQGIRQIQLDEKGNIIYSKDSNGKVVPKLKWIYYGTYTYKLSNGEISTVEYENYIKDLVNYLVFMGEPIHRHRNQIGYLVLMFLLVILLPLTYFLNKEYWKDVDGH